MVVALPFTELDNRGSGIAPARQGRSYPTRHPIGPVGLLPSQRPLPSMNLTTNRGPPTDRLPCTVTDVLEAILLNLLASAIWDLAVSPILAGGVSQQGTGDAEDSPFRQAVARSLDLLSGPSADGHFDLDRLADFLSASEIRALVRALYLFRLDENGRGVEQARADFLQLWERGGLSEDDVGIGVFDALLTGVEQALDVAIAEGILSAHEARSAARHQMTKDHLEAIGRKLSLLLDDGNQFDPAAADQFETDLRAEVVRRHAHITPPDFFGAPRVPIESLYVPPRLIPAPRTSQEGSAALTIPAWLKASHRSIVLGDPGGGKSTLAKKICYSVGSHTQGWELTSGWYSPVLVVLRDYATAKTERGTSIRDFIEDLARSSYQLDVPEGALEYVLLSGRILMVFDGLDELLQAPRRQEIRDDVESFGRRYPTVPIVVTSRVVGYEQAPLDNETFSTVRLAEFSDEQVSEYAEKWFALDESSTPPEQAATASAFVDESRSVPDLRVNPLLLALMCNFYRGQNYLPRHLPEVYENCARMLFETWDRSRGIVSVLPIAEHIRPAMRYLASWIYDDEALQGGVTERNLVQKAGEFLHRWRFDDEHEARHAAEAFIEFCRGRAWVFTDTGSTAGEALFQFTHRTFLEYFAADHLVSTSSTTSDLSDALLPRIANQEWDVVAQIAFQIKSRASLGAADDLLGDLVREAQRLPEEDAQNCLSFASRCLSFLVPRPEVAREVTRANLEFVLRVIAREEREGARSSRMRLPELLAAVLRTGAELRTAVAATAKDLLVARINDLGEAGVAAAILAYELKHPQPDLTSGGSISPEAFLQWAAVGGQVLAETKERHNELGASSLDSPASSVSGSVSRRASPFR